MSKNNDTTDDRTLEERIKEEMVLDRCAELGRLARETDKIAGTCEHDAPAVEGHLRDVAADLREARAMLNGVRNIADRTEDSGDGTGGDD